jgi:hypothetical protein
LAYKYEKNMRAAAFRNLLAAEHLDATDRRDRAGYLYGWAAECGLKALMKKLGIEESAERTPGDPFWSHFPELKQLIRDHNKPRKIVDLNKFTTGKFMEYWHTSMRYSDGKAIKAEWIDRWHEDAKNITAEL